MAATSVIKVSGYVTDESQLGTRAINLPDFTNSVAPGSASTIIELASGDNTITLPNISATSVCKGAVVVFDPASTTTKKFKGNAGDTGITVRKTGYNYLSFDDTPPASFIINSSAADTDKVTQIILV